MKNFKRISFVVLSTLLFLALNTPLFAMGLDQAKSQGLVGETPTGYLASVQADPPQQVQLLVKEINSKRRLEYSKIAKETGAPLQSVEILAGKKAIEKARPGNYVQIQGSWKKK